MSSQPVLEAELATLSVHHVMTVISEEFRGVYFIGVAEGAPIYVGESASLRDVLRKPVTGAPEEAACIRPHKPIQVLFAVMRTNHATRRDERQTVVEFFRHLCNREQAEYWP